MLVAVTWVKTSESIGDHRHIPDLSHAPVVQTAGAVDGGTVNGAAVA
jgi:hypothetical protein